MNSFYTVQWLYCAAVHCLQGLLQVYTLPPHSNRKLYYPMNCYPRNVNQLRAPFILVWSSHLFTSACSTNCCPWYFFVSQACRGFALILYIVNILLHLMIDVGHFGLDFFPVSKSISISSTTEKYCGKKIKFKHSGNLLSQRGIPLLTSLLRV